MLVLYEIKGKVKLPKGKWKTSSGLVKTVQNSVIMLLEWPEHDKKLTEGLTHLHQLNAFHDVTLSAEGKQIKAHRVVLASVSSYFKVGVIKIGNITN